MKSTLKNLPSAYQHFLRSIFGLLLFPYLSSFAQAPQRFAYQAVLRNSNNQLLVNQQVGIRISIQQGSANGPDVYAETHTPTTDGNGLVTLQVGGGLLVSGSFASINWGNGPYFIKTETDTSGGSNYIISTSQQLLSVPYALFAETSGSSIPGPQGPPGNGFNNGTALNQMLYWNGNAWATLNPGSNGQSLTICNGSLTWTSGGICPGSISALLCNTVGINGSILSGVIINQAGFSVSYTGGNGGLQNGQTVASTGVTGLTATLLPGVLNNGNGTLNYSISGMAADTGIAVFVILVGGQSCSITIPVSSSASVTSCGATGVLNSTLNYNTLVTSAGTYRTIAIGSQEWMAENLDASWYSNMYDIPEIESASGWASDSTGASCWNNNDSAATNCPYGKLYNWYAVNHPNHLCPVGWHIPTETDFMTLTNYLGGISVAGGHMKSAGTQYWPAPNAAADNSGGFSSLPSGSRSFDGSFLGFGVSATFWTSTSTSASTAKAVTIQENASGITFSTENINKGFSVRCIRD